MIDQNWFAEYFSLYNDSFTMAGLASRLIELKEKMVAINETGKKVIIAGNGGSAAIAGHCAVDFSKNAHIRMVCFNMADLITCLANDYGYTQWLAKAIEIYGDEGDMAILISSSGRSENMVQAAAAARNKGMTVVTLTGFHENNPLKQAGDLNLWLNSRAYNIVEMTHQIWLLAVCDAIIGKAEYPAN
ncbi:MAG: SIS domain-containing protein [Desulfobacteraceae bacterium]|nr:SIS domain-containing protein [Desulfobacteraceae bacterium]